MKKLAFLLTCMPLPVWAESFGTDNTLAAGSLLKVSGVLLLIILLIFFITWLINRIPRVSAGLRGDFPILATTNLGVKERISLVKAGNRYLLLGIATGSVNVLCDFGEQLPEGFSLDEKKNFSDLFKKAMRLNNK